MKKQLFLLSLMVFTLSGCAGYLPYTTRGERIGAQIVDLQPMEKDYAKFLVQGLTDSSKYPGLGGLQAVEITDFGIFFKYDVTSMTTASSFTSSNSSSSRPYLNIFRQNSAVNTHSYSSTIYEVPVQESVNRNIVYQDIERIDEQRIRVYGTTAEKPPRLVGEIDDSYYCIVSMRSGNPFVISGDDKVTIDRIAQALSLLSGKDISYNIACPNQGLIFEGNSSFVIGMYEHSLMDQAGVPIWVKICAIDSDRDQTDQEVLENLLLVSSIPGRHSITYRELGQSKASKAFIIPNAEEKDENNIPTPAGAK